MDRKTSESISVFFPVYNDARSIGKLVSDVSDVLERRFRRWEIILVDDGSEDDSAQVVDRLAAADGRIKAVHHGVNRGYGAALNTGFTHSTGDLVFYTDGDGQYDPRELERLLDHLDGADVVSGFKRSRSDHALRVFEGRFYHVCSRVVFGLFDRDIDCDFRLLRRHVVRHILPLESTGGAVGTEILWKVHNAAWRVTEVAVHHYPRPYGRSQFFRARRIAHAVYELTRFWLRGGTSGRRTRRRPTAGSPGPHEDRP